MGLSRGKLAGQWSGGSPGKPEAPPKPAPKPARRPRGRPRKDDFTRDPDPASGGRPLPVAPPGDDPELFKLAGTRVPLIYIARGLGIPIEDLQEGGRLCGIVYRGILAYAADVCEATHLKARSLTGNPIPGIHWAKCNLKFRETGENETEIKKVRQIKRVSWRVIEGGLKGGPGGGGEPTAGRGSADGPSAGDGAPGAVNGPVSGDTRG